MDDCVVLSANRGLTSTVYVLRIDQMHVAKVSSWEVQGEVTCLSMFKNGQTHCIVVGTELNASPNVLIFAVDHRLLFAQELKILEGKKHPV